MRYALTGIGFAALLGACAGDETTAPRAPSSAAAETLDPTATLAEQVRELAKGRGIGPLAAPPRVRPALVRLGQALAFDKILSGNHDIACMTCHLPRFSTGDSRSLSIGQGASGLGPTRVHPDGIFIPRNAPQLFNLHALQPLFWDGRVSVDARGGFHTPAGPHLTPAMTRVFEFGPVSALPLFPVLSRSEMRADAGNELAAISDGHERQVWRALMARLGRVPRYRSLFERAYPGTKFEQMTFAHASNAIAGFLIDRLAFNQSPWDQFLAGDDAAMTETQLLGAKDFLSARCSICHNGPAFTDNQFHNVALAQLGPGEGDGAGGRDDFGRMRVTGDPADRYRFRTTPLRNVELTGPYGHDGAFTDLRAFVDHYSESDLKLRSFDPNQLEPALRGTVLGNLEAVLATRDTLLQGVVFPATTIDEVTEFLRALTDPTARDLSAVVPSRVPSGLPVDR